MPVPYCSVYSPLVGCKRLQHFIGCRLRPWMLIKGLFTFACHRKGMEEFSIIACVGRQGILLHLKLSTSMTQSLQLLLATSHPGRFTSALLMPPSSICLWCMLPGSTSLGSMRMEACVKLLPSNKHVSQHLSFMHTSCVHLLMAVFRS